MALWKQIDVFIFFMTKGETNSYRKLWRRVFKKVWIKLALINFNIAKWIYNFSINTSLFLDGSHQTWGLSCTT